MCEGNGRHRGCIPPVRACRVTPPSWSDLTRISYSQGHRLSFMILVDLPGRYLRVGFEDWKNATLQLVFTV